jgi:hypothetical protein
VAHELCDLALHLAEARNILREVGSAPPVPPWLSFSNIEAYADGLRQRWLAAVQALVGSTEITDPKAALEQHLGVLRRRLETLQAEQARAFESLRAEING